MRTKGLAKKRLEQRRILVDKIDVFASKIRSLAKARGDTVLYEKVNYSPSEIWRLRDLLIETRVANLVVIGTELLPESEEYQLTQVDIDDLIAEKEKFYQLRSLPKEAIKAKKEATQNIDKLMKELRELVVERLDSDMKKYKLSHPDFYDGYLLQREINDTPTHQISLLGKIIDTETDEPLLDVTVTIEKLKEETKTTELGNYRFKTLEPGTYGVTFRKEGYQTQTHKAEINEGKTITLDIKLGKIENL